MSGDPQYFRRGYDQCVRDAILRFHRTQSVEDARRYVREAVTRAGTNEDRILDSLDKFERYISWWESEHPVLADVRIRLELPLFAGVALGGLVSRIDYTDRGYRAVLLGGNTAGWMAQDRFPVIQRALASLYEVPEQEFSVGVQELNGSGLATTTFTQLDVQAAVAAAMDAAEQVANTIG